MNPIVGREFRSRWRERRAFGLVLGYSAVLSLAMLWLCHELLRLPEQTAQLSTSPQRTGYAIFIGLSWMQTLGWMLLAPALTATTIAGEREQGLLESLQLAPLSPRQIAWGKLASALLFALLLWSCALPISAICFMLGGVSPGQYFLSSLIQLVTAVTGAMVGLYFSAWSHRAGAALRKTFAALIVWSIGSMLCAIVPVGTGLTTRLMYLVGSSNPIVAVLSALESSSGGIYILRSRGFTPYAWWIDILVDLPPWTLSWRCKASFRFAFHVRGARSPSPAAGTILD
jgi:ABC-type transport system involved in multi-copper enzyme maturation permease subunit